MLPKQSRESLRTRRPAPFIAHSEKTIVGHHQTKQHRWGRSSYHQIGLVRGQFFDRSGRLVASCAQEGLIRKRG